MKGDDIGYAIATRHQNPTSYHITPPWTPQLDNE